MARISLLIDSPLRDLAIAMRGLGPQVRREINKQTKQHGAKIWNEEISGRIMSAHQSRLASSAKIGVTNRNIFLRAGSRGKIGETPLTTLVYATEFGVQKNRVVNTTSRRGKQYQRKLGTTFPLRRRRGYLIYPAASEAIPRLVRLWIQTTVRTAHESIEKVK